ncbi:Alpha,alpha-trehalose-phosphate synthase [UDP-forming] 5 [Heracleum sosnowskyi]|uniref:Alpha,alpha-trehalose-phosphate synthase [UDP-forming] 5 n=1 Tax=Heracleum sosnowskyi TaxID=360622 RepID=A0AAD8MST9_9APIA|nr:Alpha,alpha-trehalose-phosphate synthase [UDP-forming] 5 [Heracleum sosnowskyi]
MQEKWMLPDFVLCVGDDRFDEDMFEVIMSAMAGPSLSPVAEVFACTVGQKPRKAKYYLEDTTEILKMLQGLATTSEECIRNAHIRLLCSVGEYAKKSSSATSDDGVCNTVVNPQGYVCEEHTVILLAFL